MGILSWLFPSKQSRRILKNTKKSMSKQDFVDQCVRRINGSVNEILQMRQEDPYILWNLPFHQEYSSLLDFLETQEQYEIAFTTATMAKMQGWKDFGNISFENRLKAYHEINPYLAADFVCSEAKFDPFLVSISVGLQMEREKQFNEAISQYIDALKFRPIGDLVAQKYIECASYLKSRELLPGKPER